MKAQRYGNANSIGELTKLLQRFMSEHGSDGTWGGYDDGCVYLNPNVAGVPEFYITHDEEESNAKDSKR